MNNIVGYIMILWMLAYIHQAEAMNIHQFYTDVHLPRINISWSAMGRNIEYRLEARKINGLPISSLNTVREINTNQDFIVFDAEFGAEYNCSLYIKNGTATNYMYKNFTVFDTKPAPRPIQDKEPGSTGVKLLVLHVKDALYYHIVAHKMNPLKVNRSNLPDPGSIRSEFLRGFTTNSITYITLNISQSDMNETDSVYVIGNGKINGGVLNAKLDGYYSYAFFQRTFVEGRSAPISHPWTPILEPQGGPKRATEDDEVVIISISVLIGVIAFIIILVFCCYLKYSRNYAPKPVKKKRTDPVQRLSIDPAIPVTECDFYDHVAQMKFHNFKGFYEEYTNMEVPFKPTEEFRNPDNNSKNRFLNVPCYDHSRVPIEPRNDKSTYIHANFVPGFDTDKDYILTQAPLPETIKDFWSMVFDHNVETIVMIGQEFEKGHNVCAPYFPSKEGHSVTALYGKVTLEHEHRTADYIIRTLIFTPLGSHNGPRRIKHFQFLSWPAVRITPCCPIVFLQFMRAVNKSITKSKVVHPLVIHGTTGTGRAGIYACIDTQLRRIRKQSDVNVYEAVLDVRSTRWDGVKTLDEYIFIHDTALEWILKKKIRDIDVEYLPHYIENINKSAPDELFTTEYNFLAATVVSATQKMDVANQPCNKSKNRYDTVKPFDNNRVKLTKLINTEGSDYINASYIDTYTKKKSFISTQAPLVGTVSDFWRMIYENESWVIVMLGQEIEKGQLKADRFWPEEGYVMALGHLSVKYVSFQKDGLKDVVIRQVEIQNNKTDEKKLVQLYQYLTWPSHEHISSESIHSLVQLVHQSQMWKEKFESQNNHNRLKFWYRKTRSIHRIEVSSRRK
ncbi:receptor-type tyrosine-protein phosphatase delta-like [Clytia hemisphaerica]|uniref:protein-tyrosine-phosphatase n=1 Tax=Clytia hemisphaerica TaxID=252671 RepID=A0A7M5X7H3_9CNID